MSDRAQTFEAEDDFDAINRLYRERKWSDGLPIVPPTLARVDRMLATTQRQRYDVVAQVAPGYGAATVERIAINAVMAGCDADYLPVLIAATEAVADPEFNLQGVQATTNPVAVWLILNGPIAKKLNVNAGFNCIGQGTWANATLGRAMRLILQNIGGALPGEMDRSTHGQPAKFTFCCAENEEASPWEPLHVERGHGREESAVTVVAAEGTMNMNTHSKEPNELHRRDDGPSAEQRVRARRRAVAALLRGARGSVFTRGLEQAALERSAMGGVEDAGGTLEHEGASASTRFAHRGAGGDHGADAGADRAERRRDPDSRCRRRRHAHGLRAELREQPGGDAGCHRVTVRHGIASSRRSSQ